MTCVNPFPTVLVSKCYCNKLPHTRGLMQCKFILSQIWTSEGILGLHSFLRLHGRNPFLAIFSVQRTCQHITLTSCFCLHRSSHSLWPFCLSLVRPPVTATGPSEARQSSITEALVCLQPAGTRSGPYLLPRCPRRQQRMSHDEVGSSVS